LRVLVRKKGNMSHGGNLFALRGSMMRAREKNGASRPLLRKSRSKEKKKNEVDEHSMMNKKTERKEKPGRKRKNDQS